MMEEASEGQASATNKVLPSTKNISKIMRRGTLMTAFRDAMNTLQNKNGVDTRTIAKFIGHQMDTPTEHILPRLNDVINMAEGMGMVEKVASKSYILKDSRINLCGVCGGMKSRRKASCGRKKARSCGPKRRKSRCGRESRMSRCGSKQRKCSRGRKSRMSRCAPKRRTCSRGRKSRMSRCGPKRRKSSRGRKSRMSRCGPKRRKSSRGRKSRMSRCGPKRRKSSRGRKSRMSRCRPKRKMSRCGRQRRSSSMRKSRRCRPKKCDGDTEY